MDANPKALVTMYLLELQLRNLKLCVPEVLRR
jgi:hypothetical protein